MAGETPDAICASLARTSIQRRHAVNFSIQCHRDCACSIRRSASKILIGAHRARPVRLSHHPHRRQRAGVPRRRHLQPVRRTRSSSNPLIPVIEIGLLLVFLVHIYKTVKMFLRQPAGAAGRLRHEEAGRHAEPQDARLVDDDRLGAVAAGVHRHPRQGVPVRRRIRDGRPADATSIGSRWRTSATR